jgi:hypothetical protein
VLPRDRQEPLSEDVPQTQCQVKQTKDIPYRATDVVMRAHPEVVNPARQ